MPAIIRRVRFGICLSAKPGDDLQVGKAYRILPDAKADAVACVRVIDDSGEDYLYANKRFLIIDLPKAARDRLLKAVGKESGLART